jgi:hypothetical protein
MKILFFWFGLLKYFLCVIFETHCQHPILSVSFYFLRVYDLICNGRLLALVALTIGLRQSQNGFTALMLAATRGRIECARVLLGVGVGTEAKSNVRYAQYLVFQADL